MGVYRKLAYLGWGTCDLDVILYTGRVDIVSIRSLEEAGDTGNLHMIAANEVSRPILGQLLAFFFCVFGRGEEICLI